MDDAQEYLTRQIAFEYRQNVSQSSGFSLQSKDPDEDRVGEPSKGND
tara:strand:+ start:54 stop:194 length:141 start_codon:yes stop_codon:yes gene_type:complete